MKCGHEEEREEDLEEEKYEYEEELEDEPDYSSLIADAQDPAILLNLLEEIRSIPINELVRIINHPCANASIWQTIAENISITEKILDLQTNIDLRFLKIVAELATDDLLRYKIINYNNITIEILEILEHGTISQEMKLTFQALKKLYTNDSMISWQELYLLAANKHFYINTLNKIIEQPCVNGHVLEILIIHPVVLNNHELMWCLICHPARNLRVLTKAIESSINPAVTSLRLDPLYQDWQAQTKRLEENFNESWDKQNFRWDDIIKEIFENPHVSDALLKKAINACASLKVLQVMQNTRQFSLQVSDSITKKIAKQLLNVIDIAKYLVIQGTVETLVAEDLIFLAQNTEEIFIYPLVF